MAWELRNNSGSLFKNERRTKEAHPHAQGECMIGGKVYYVSAWTKECSKGKFQSLAFKLKDADEHDTGSGGRGNQRSRRAPPPNKQYDEEYERQRDRDFDDDIPF